VTAGRLSPTRPPTGWRSAAAFNPTTEVKMAGRLSQDKAGCLILAGEVLKTGEDIEVIVGGNWHRALVRKAKRGTELILDNGRGVAGLGLMARRAHG
jgi:hypothetical protein